MYTGPKIVRDGLVLNLNAGDTKSFRGEPTVNLAYNSNGIIDWNISNLVAAVSRIEITTNSIYRITSTTGGAFRIAFNASKLINAKTYTLSYTYKIISGGTTFSMSDWCDTALFNRVDIDYNSYKFSSASGTRSTYDTIYRFMDFNISANTIVEIWDLQLEEKPYSTPFVNGTRGSTVATGGGWSDRSGNGNHGELVNGVGYNSGNSGSLVFDGVDDRINIGNTITSINTSELSIELFFRTNISTSNVNILIGWHNTQTSHGYICLGNFTGHWSNESISFYNQGTSTTDLSFAYTNGHSFLQDTNWHHTIFVLNTNNYRIYIDGSEVTINTSFRNGSPSTTFPNNLFGYGSTPSVALGVGGSQPSYGNINIASTKIYNRALTPTEVLQNYNATKSRFNL
jgi:hypothetical protein